jgi:hypothetical protein
VGEGRREISLHRLQKMKDYLGNTHARSLGHTNLTGGWDFVLITYLLGTKLYLFCPKYLQAGKGCNDGRKPNGRIYATFYIVFIIIFCGRQFSSMGA